MCLSSVAVLVGPLNIVFLRLHASRPMWVNISTRIAIGILLIVSIYAVAPSWWSLLSWPIGVALGCDMALTARRVGWAPSPLRWWVAFQLSPIHLGVLGGLVGAALAVGVKDVVPVALPVYATTQLWVATMWCTGWLLSRVLTQQLSEFEDLRRRTISDEHRRSSHWLHDDICAQLRLVTLKLQAGETSQDEIGVMLDQLDFQLRLRQLDELLDSGSVRLAEVLQPFLRNAQQHHIAVEQVPSYEVASTQVDRETGVKFQRATAVLTANAMIAGTRLLRYAVAVNEHSITLVVEDDAGGFDPSDLHTGRGLWSLREDFGRDSMNIERTAIGSRVTVSIPRREWRLDGTAAAR